MFPDRESESSVSSSRHRRLGHVEKSPLKPPPNYSSRAVQLKLFMLVGGLMLVVWLMFEARKPENWAFMGFDRAQREEAADESVDTRYYPQLKSPQDEAAVIDEDVAAQDELELNSLEAIEENSTDDQLFDRTRRDFWKLVFLPLEPLERQRLFLGMQQGRLRSRLEGDDEVQAWMSLVDAVDTRRDEYEQQILRAIAALPANELRKRDVWTTVLQRMQKTWEVIGPALRQVPEGTSDAQADALQELQVILDQLALGLVEDDALRARLPEREAWYRQFERLRAFDLQQKMAGEHAPVIYEPVSFLQLFKQPKVYRGQPIQVRGKVYLVQYQQADENPYGVTGYHLFWIRPEGTADSPIQVYALRLPEGFPEYEDNQQRVFDGATAEEVVVDGVFFKRVAYEGRDGFRLAPLILTTEPTWNPKPPPEPVGEAVPEWSTIAIVSLVVGLIAISVARIAMRTAGRKSSPGFRMPSRDQEPDPAQITRLMSEHDQGEQVFADDEERT